MEISILFFLTFPQLRDEDNLEENERIKKELNPRKIDEPKTPYLSPQATEDEEEMLGKKGVGKSCFTFLSILFSTACFVHLTE